MKCPLEISVLFNKGSVLLKSLVSENCEDFFTMDSTVREGCCWTSDISLCFGWTTDMVLL